MGYFTTYLALSGPAWVGLTTLGYRYRRIYAEAAFSIAHPNRRDELGRPFVAELDDIKVMVEFLDSPLPAEAYERALEMNYAWPEAGAVLAAQKGHVVVSLVNEPKDHVDALNGAAAVTLVSGALSDLLPTVAVVSSEGAVVMPPDTFVPLAQELSREQIPIPFWTSLAFFRGEPDAEGVRKQGAYSVGLRPFIGRELEFAPSNMEPIEIAERMVGLFQMLILNGPILQDGETVGATEEERIHISFKSSSVLGDVRVISLSMQEQAAAPNEAAAPVAQEPDLNEWNSEIGVHPAETTRNTAFDVAPPSGNWWGEVRNEPARAAFDEEPAGFEVDKEPMGATVAQDAVRAEVEFAQAPMSAPSLDPGDAVITSVESPAASAFPDWREPDPLVAPITSSRHAPPQPIGLLHDDVEPEVQNDVAPENSDDQTALLTRPQPKPMDKARLATAPAGKSFGRRNLS